MKIIEEFKEFAVKGNVVDMAVGIIIGGAFGKIVTSLVNDVLTPVIGVVMGGINFSDMQWIIIEAVKNAEGVVTSPAVILSYGKFIQAVTDFLIVAWAMFLMIKAINNIRRSQEQLVERMKKPVDEKARVTTGEK